MAVAKQKKTTTTSTKDASGKKVTFAQEKRVKTFHKDKALLKRKAEQDLADQQVKEPKKTKPAIRQAASKKNVQQEADLPSSDEEEEEEQVRVQVDTDADALTEEQEEALRKEILGDMIESDDEVNEEDSSDEEEDGKDLIGENASVVSLSKKKKEESTAEKKKNKKKTEAATTTSNTTGWVYVGRIPSSFTEADMRKYFEQFGDIVQLRISRNKRGQSRHYGFIEFLAQDVAEIVAETMNNYLLDGRLLQCKTIPLHQRHPDTFTIGKKKQRHPNAVVRQYMKEHNKDQPIQHYFDRANALVRSEEKKRATLKELNIDYDFPGYAASKSYWEPMFLAKLKEEGTKVDVQVNKDVQVKATKVEIKAEN